MARKHYRAAKKQIEHSPAKGTFVLNKHKPKLIALGIGILILAFLKGMLVGILIGRNE